MNKQLIFIDESILFKREVQIDHLYEQQQSLPVVISKLPYVLLKESIDLRLDTFICLNGQQIILQDKILRNSYLPKEELTDVIQLCSYTKHPIALYYEDRIEISCIDQTVKEYQYYHKESKFVEVAKFSSLENVLQVKVFNETQRKDILYETFYHKKLSFKRADPYSIVLGTNQQDQMEAIVYLKRVYENFL